MRAQPSTADFEDGIRGHEPRNVGDLSKLEMAREWIHLWSLSGKTTVLPADNVILVQRGPPQKPAYAL